MGEDGGEEDGGGCDELHGCFGLLLLLLDICLMFDVSELARKIFKEIMIEVISFKKCSNRRGNQYFKIVVIPLFFAP